MADRPETVRFRRWRADLPLPLVARSPQELALLVLAHLLAALLDHTAQGGSFRRLALGGAGAGGVVRWPARVKHRHFQDRTAPRVDSRLSGGVVRSEFGSRPAIRARIIPFFLGLCLDDAKKPVLGSPARVALVPRILVRNGGRLPSSRICRPPIGGKSTTVALIATRPEQLAAPLETGCAAPRCTSKRTGG